MANIFINKDGLFYSAPGGSSTNYSQYSTYGSATYSGFTQKWTGINLVYTPGYIFPSFGTLTSLTVSTVSGTFLYSADSFSYNLFDVPLLTGPDSVIYLYVAQAQPNSILGSVNDDILLAARDGDSLNGGLGNDTIYLWSPSTSYSITNIGANNGSATIRSLADNSVITIISIGGVLNFV